jgi:hypothetical protein
MSFVLVLVFVVILIRWRRDELENKLVHTAICFPLNELSFHPADLPVPRPQRLEVRYRAHAKAEGGEELFGDGSRVGLMSVTNYWGLTLGLMVWWTSERRT